MKDEDKSEISELIAKAISESKSTNQSWFTKLSNLQKFMTVIIGFFIAISTLGTGVSGVLNFVFQDEIEEYNQIHEQIGKLNKVDSLIVYSISLNTRYLDSLKEKNNEGSNFYAVGYRAEKRDDGKIIRYYRDWDGNIFQIYPDPYYSTNTFTHWFFNKEDGTKEYTFGK